MRICALCTITLQSLASSLIVLIYSSDLQSGNVLLRSDSSHWQHTVSLECSCYLHTGRNFTHEKFSNFVGQKFAMMELKVILASLLLNFNIEATQRRSELRSSSGIIVSLSS